LGALGDGFAGGTTDGPGDFDFKQGTNSTHTNAYWNFIGQFLSEPSKAEKECQAPKPILLNTGGITLPAPWTADILSLHILRLGKFHIVGVPGEFTTMSGRRLRDAALAAIPAANRTAETTFVIAGLSNTYSHYIATKEEFQAQRYEAASTLYGPNTLDSYLTLYSDMVTKLFNGQPIAPGPTPPDLSNKTFSFQPAQPEDVHPIGKPYGTVLSQPATNYSAGGVVTVEFVAGNPNNDYRTQSTYLTVEQYVSGTGWQVIAVDGDWETRMQWRRKDLLESVITVQWFIPSGQAAGAYRIQHFGQSKSLFGDLSPYSGTSNSFIVG